MAERTRADHEREDHEREDHEREDHEREDREREDHEREDHEPPAGPIAPGNLDAMPHVHRRARNGALIDEAGNVIPPARQNGRAGTDDITWEAGLPHRADDAEANDR